MNIQFENQDENSLMGSFRCDPNPQEVEMIEKQDLKGYQEEYKEIIHQIQYGDTLEGISLTYDVPIGKIKSRNKIEGDSIYFLKMLIIPDPKIEQKKSKQFDEFLKIEEFMTYMNIQQKSQKSARYYLSENNWIVQNAVKQYKQDLQWEKKNAIQTLPMKAVSYRQVELHLKKNQ